MIQTLPLPWPAPILSLNKSMHRMKEYRLRNEVRDAVITLARHHKLKAVDTARVELHWRAAVKRSRDEDNQTAMLKPCIDGLAKAGVLPYGDASDVLSSRVRIHPPIKGEPAAMWLVIETELR